MANNDGVRLQLSDVEVKPSSGRETPNTSFADTLQNGIATTANVASNAASSAGYMMVPGAAVLGAAVTSVGQVKASAGANGVPNGGGFTGMGLMGGGVGGGGMYSGTGSMGGMSMMSSGGSVYAQDTSGLGSTGMGTMAQGTSQYGGYMNNVASRAAAGDSGSQMMMATQQMQEMNQQFNLQYLQLQEKMQQEGREFTCMSNVMKAKNDTAKNSLSNLK